MRNTSPRHCRRRRSLRRLLLGCLIAASTSAAPPALAGPWDCGSDIVPVTEPLPEEVTSAAEATGKPVRKTAATPGQCGAVGEQTGESASRLAGAEAAVGLAAGEIRVALVQPAAVQPPLAARRTALSFASSLERLSGDPSSSLAGRSPLAVAPLSEPGNAEKGRQESDRNEPSVAGESPAAAMVAAADRFLRRHLESLAASDWFSTETLAAPVEAVAAEDDFLRRRLDSLTADTGLSTETLAGAVEPVADAAEFDELIRPIPRGEGPSAADVADVAVETCLGSCFVVEPDRFAAPPRAAAEEVAEDRAAPADTPEDEFLKRQLAMLATEEPSGAHSLAQPVEPVAGPDALAKLIEPLRSDAAVASAGRASAGRGEPGAVAEAAGQPQADAAPEAEPAPSRGGGSIVVATLEEAYLPYDLTPQDRRAAARYSLDGEPFCLRDAAPAAQEAVAEAPVEAVPAGVDAEPAGADKTASAIAGSPHCLLDELIWRGERALSDGAPLREALTPSALGRQLAAAVSQRNRAAVATSQWVAAAWPERTGAQAGGAGERLLARAGATEGGGTDAAVAGGVEQGGAEADASEAGATQAMLAKVEPDSHRGGDATDRPAQLPSDPSAGTQQWGGAAEQERAHQQAQWTAAAAQLRRWVSEAGRWSRQLWEVARQHPMTGDRAVR